MAHFSHPGHRRLPLYLRRPWRRIFWPMLGLAAGGTILNHILEEESLGAADGIPFAALLILIGLLSQLKHFLFR